MSDELTPTQYLVDAIRHEDNAIADRTEWFLVFHAILLEAYFTAGGSSDVHKNAVFAVALFGLISAVLWFFVGCRQRVNHDFFTHCLKDAKITNPDIARVFGGIGSYRERVSKTYRWARATPIFTVVIPLATSVLWLFLIATMRGLRLLHVAIAVVVALVCWILTCSLIGRPKVTDTNLAPLRPNGKDQHKVSTLL